MALEQQQAKATWLTKLPVALGVFVTYKIKEDEKELINKIRQEAEIEPDRMNVRVGLLSFKAFAVDLGLTATLGEGKEGDWVRDAFLDDFRSWCSMSAAVDKLKFWRAKSGDEARLFERVLDQVKVYANAYQTEGERVPSFGQSFSVASRFFDICGIHSALKDISAKALAFSYQVDGVIEIVNLVEKQS